MESRGLVVEYSLLGFERAVGIAITTKCTLERVGSLPDTVTILSAASMRGHREHPLARGR
jgi:hypothetical protein